MMTKPAYLLSASTIVVVVDDQFAANNSIIAGDSTTADSSAQQTAPLTFVLDSNQTLEREKNLCFNTWYFPEQNLFTRLILF